MREWLAQALGQMGVNEEAEGYLLGRGVKPEDIAGMRLASWEPPREGWVADKAWLRHGEQGRGEYLRGMLSIPLWSARGELIGVDFRQVSGSKQVLRYLVSEARTPEGKTWHAVFVGMNPAVAKALWEGAPLWLVEGFFDLCAMRWVIPKNHQVLACDKAALNDAQLALLRRVLPPGSWVGLVLDMDKAGRRGTSGWRDKAGKHHVGVAQALREAGLCPWNVPYLEKDPGELWDRGGKAALEKAFGDLSKD